MKYRYAGFLTAVLGMFLLSLPVCPGADYYVSPEGSDEWTGQLPEPDSAGDDGPFRTLSRAVRACGPADTCYIRDGVYHETLRPTRSGEPGEPITFTNYQDEAPVISGADAVTGWQEVDQKIWAASMDLDLKDRNQIFADGQMLWEARWPNNSGTLLQPDRATADAGSKNTLKDADLPGDDDAWKGALLWCAGGREWICWSREVTGYDASSHTLKFELNRDRWYTPQKGNPYVLIGALCALDAPGEWWYDGQKNRLLLYPPDGKKPDSVLIEAKRRALAIDLSGRSHIRLRGLHFRAGGLKTNGKSSHLVLDRLDGEYLGHSYARDVSGSGSVQIHGHHITVKNCEFARSSGSVIHLSGHDNRVINCHIHTGNYAGLWSGVMKSSGRRHVIAYNTIEHSGRDVMSTGRLMQSIVEHNDLAHAGWLTSDLGLTYGHNTDFANTVFRYNHAHDNHAEMGMGIYFDHCSHNVIVHHNVVWNMSRDPVRINNPSYFNVVCNNTGYDVGGTGTFDHSHRGDMFGSRYLNNLYSKGFNLPDHVVLSHNIVDRQLPVKNPDDQDFTLTTNSSAVDNGMVIPGIMDGYKGKAPDVGAYEYGKDKWQAGHDFDNPPSPLPEWKPAEVAYMNAVKNACFEFGTLESWEKTGAGNAKIVDGNGWGNNWGDSEPVPTGTSRHELLLGGGLDGVKQTVEGLNPGTEHSVSAWTHVSGPGETVELAITGHGGPEVKAVTSSKEWKRLVVRFTTGPNAESATIHLRKTSEGDGHAFCDNVGLPRMPAAK